MNYAKIITECLRDWRDYSIHVSGDKITLTLYLYDKSISNTWDVISLDMAVCTEDLIDRPINFMIKEIKGE